MNEIEAAKQRILLDIDSITEPSQMSQQQAVEFLEELIADLETRVEAINEEMEGN